MPSITPAYVAYLEGELADALEEIYKDDETPHGRAFEDKLQFVIQTYCQQHDQAGEQTADFVRHIPFNAAFGIEGAVGGLMVLRRTRAALLELLEHDKEFLESYRGDKVTSDEEDRAIRADAAEYTKRNEVGEDINRIVRKTAAEGEATEKDIVDAAYGSADGARTEFDVALSARDRLEPPPAIAAVPSMPEAADATEAPRAIDIRPVTRFGESPSLAFNAAKKWFTDAIIRVASGSDHPGAFPRIAPLIDHPELGAHGTTRDELLGIVRDIRDFTGRLRPPLSERHDDLLFLLENVVKKGGDGEDVRDVMRSFDEMFGDPDRDTYGMGLNDWKGGSDD